MLRLVSEGPLVVMKGRLGTLYYDYCSIGVSVVLQRFQPVSSPDRSTFCSWIVKTV